MSDILVYALSGNSGSGKDYLAGVLRSMLPQNRRSMFLSVADELKVGVIVEDRMDYQRVYIKKDVESRRALQLRGTEKGRNVHGADIWVRYLLTWLRVHIDRGIQTFFITDIRFPEEFQAMRTLSTLAELGHPEVILIRVLAPQRTYARRHQETNGDEEKIRLIASHPSERALDGYDNSEFDKVLYNDPGENAIDEIRNIALAEHDKFKHVVFLDLDDTLCECSVHYIECKNQAQALVVQFIENVNSAGDSQAGPSFDKGFEEHRRNYEKEPFTREIFAEALVEAAQFCLGRCGLIYHPETPGLYAIIRQVGMSVFDKGFSALPGAVESANWLNQLSSVKVVIVTVGERPDQLRKLWKLGLGSIDCQCTSLKSVQTYRAWMQMYPAHRYTMVGDSFIRDIEPALKAGIQCAIHVGPRRCGSDLAGHIQAENLEAALTYIV